MHKYKELRNIYRFVTDELEITPGSHDVRDLIHYAQVVRDFDWDFPDGSEWRFIHEDVIDDIYLDTIKDTITECYLNGTDLDKYWWIAIDWDKTADNLRTADGYGVTFAHYDHVEYHYKGWYIFRTN